METSLYRIQTANLRRTKLTRYQLSSRAWIILIVVDHNFDLWFAWKQNWESKTQNNWYSLRDNDIEVKNSSGTEEGSLKSKQKLAVNHPTPPNPTIPHPFPVILFVKMLKFNTCKEVYSIFTGAAWLIFPLPLGYILPPSLTEKLIFCLILLLFWCRTMMAMELTSLA